MKNLIPIITLFIGLVAGFFLSPKVIYFSKDPAPATEISVDDARGFIDSLYKKPEKVIETINPSYVFDLKNILANGHALGISEDKMQLRIFPALSKNDSLTFVLALEDDQKLYLTKLGLFEYIAPCPNKCPVKDDIFGTTEWVEKYKAAFPKRPELIF